MDSKWKTPGGKKMASFWQHRWVSLLNANPGFCEATSWRKVCLEIFNAWGHVDGGEIHFAPLTPWLKPGFLEVFTTKSSFQGFLYRCSAGFSSIHSRRPLCKMDGCPLFMEAKQSKPVTFMANQTHLKRAPLASAQRWFQCILSTML